ncbi:hypothetical protein F3Y22_tig00111783pilonHSYRG00438 [Hibiscus syriacus]|uniref:Uncharacterized protein n=1 Tax=Hibiscus syriacus TaxID=106335 RepID=A0A6A2YGR5_HIBSY|nr:hypothetical protein F3Y22_tig00111783pilonHSYRG00438 [Hibiscus syriacus]
MTGSPEKLTAVTEESGVHPSNRQISFTSSNVNAATESSSRRNSMKRSPPPWLLDPKRIDLFFATL